MSEWRDSLIRLFEELSNSVSTSRIFWKLFKNGEMSISQLIRQTGLNHKIVRKSLEEMIAKEFVRRKSFGRMKIYFLNRDNYSIRVLLSLLSGPPPDLFSKDNRVVKLSQTSITQPVEDSASEGIVFRKES